MRSLRLLPVVALCAAAAGCFNEPEPAYRSVPADARVYLNDRGLADLAFLTGEGGALAPRESVDYVNLDRNRLESVAGIERLTGLKWLRLNGNRLASLPSLAPLAKLRRIYLRDNRFAEVPATLNELPALTDVELSGNPIAEIPDWLAKKEGLLNLSFNRTKLTRLPDDLSAWRSLRSLQLGELTLSAAEMARIRKALPGVAIAF